MNNTPRLSNDEMSVIVSFISPCILQRVDVLHLRASCRFLYTSEPLHEQILRHFLSPLSDFLQNQPVQGVTWREHIHDLKQKQRRNLIALDSNVPRVPKHFPSHNWSIGINLFGAVASGKRSLIHRNVTDFFIPDLSPLEDVYQKQIVVDGTLFMNASNSYCEEIEYAPMYDQYCRHSEVIILVYHMTSPEGFKWSVESIRRTLEKLLYLKEVDCLDKLPVIIVRTKCDLDTFNARYWLQQMPDCREDLEYVENLPFPRIEDPSLGIAE